MLSRVEDIGVRGLKNQSSDMQRTDMLIRDFNWTMIILLEAGKNGSF